MRTNTYSLNRKKVCCPTWQHVAVWIPTFTNTPKKSSELSSWTLLDRVFLSLQCDACFWTSSVDSPKLGPQSACKHSVERHTHNEYEKKKSRSRQKQDGQKQWSKATSQTMGDLRLLCSFLHFSFYFIKQTCPPIQPQHWNTQDIVLFVKMCTFVFVCPKETFVEKVRTQWGSQQPVDNDVSVASDGGCEVSVERNVEGVVLK